MKVVGIEQIRRFFLDGRYRVTLLRRLFGVESIYGRAYGLGIMFHTLFFTLALLLPFGLLRDFFQKSGYEVDGLNQLLPLIALALYIFLPFIHLVRAGYVKRIFKNRLWKRTIRPSGKSRMAKLFAQAVISHEWDEDRKFLVDKIRSKFMLIDEEVILEIDKTPGPQRKTEYGLYDAIFDVWRRARGSSYKARQAYYTVFCAKLQRRVPHLVFDNKRAAGRQFRRIYLSSQQLSLDADFDDYFATYSPEYHQIETLSFITPEVLLAMMEIENCDVEFLDDHLLCYGPLLRRDQLAVFRRQCLNLYAQVNDNLTSYEARPKKIGSFARRLHKNPLRYLPGCLFAGAVAAFFLWAAFDSGRVEGLVYSGLSLIYSIYLLVKIIGEFKDNKRLKARFLK